ncbi:MAG TPA: hypothetical protein VGI74_15375 [Streptosporangiaceae bacterium]
MNPYVTQQLVSQHIDGLRKLAANGGQSSLARQARHAPGRQAPGRHAPGRQGHRPRSVRRQAGWALISLGMRLAYTAGEE